MFSLLLSHYNLITINNMLFCERSFFLLFFTKTFINKEEGSNILYLFKLFLFFVGHEKLQKYLYWL